MKLYIAGVVISVLLVTAGGFLLGFTLVNFIAQSTAKTSCATNHVVKGVWM